MTVTATNHIDIQKASGSTLPGFDFENIVFGKHFSDHMFSAEYKDGQWGNLKVMPFGDLKLSPAAGVLHYGQAIFEGMKAVRDENGKIMLFRPEENLKRLNESAERMCMPELPEDIFMDGLRQLLNIDRGWVPEKDGQSLYIRPFMFASQPVLGVRPSAGYTFLIITSPVGSYYAEPVKLKIETKFSRAAVGGVGYAKAAGNYAASLYPAKLAAQEGYHQLLWTDAKEHKYFEEAGTMNIMFYIDGKLLTPSLDDKTILRGITRDSVIRLARSWGIPVEERKISVEEVVDALETNRLKDVFGMGTAASIAHIALIGYEGKNYELPPIEQRELSNKLKKHLDGVKKGQLKDEFNWIVRV